MDNRNRLTAWEEFKLDERYFWKKGHSLKGPYVCVNRNRRLRTVTLEDEEGLVTYPRGTWPNRFITVKDAFAESALFGKGSLPVDVLEKRIKQHRIDHPPRRPYGQCCGNCEYHEPDLGICWHEQNRSKGPNDDCAHVGWNSWCPHWLKQL